MTGAITRIIDNATMQSWTLLGWTAVVAVALLGSFGEATAQTYEEDLARGAATTEQNHLNVL